MREPFSRSDNAVVGYAQYKNLGSLMPVRYDDTVSKRYGIDLIIGSPVISVVVAINHHAGMSCEYTSAFDLVIIRDN